MGTTASPACAECRSLFGKYSHTLRGRCARIFVNWAPRVMIIPNAKPSVPRSGYEAYLVNKATRFAGAARVVTMGTCSSSSTLVVEHEGNDGNDGNM